MSVFDIINFKILTFQIGLAVVPTYLVVRNHIPDESDKNSEVSSETNYNITEPDKGETN
jgi:hypothetical protein